MLDTYIIDSIQREEEARERAREGCRIWLELPLPEVEPPPRRQSEEPEYHDPIVIPLDPGRQIEEDAA